MLPGEGEGQLYEIPTNVIDSIIYHEDLIVRRAAVLIDGGQFRDAFELLCPLARQSPDWKGLKDQTQRLVFLEAQRALKAERSRVGPHFVGGTAPSEPRLPAAARACWARSSTS